MEYRTVYITTADQDEARRIGRELVNARLAACANIVPAIESIYRWQGEIHDDSETLLVAKTTQAQMEKLIEKVKQLHSYEVPCITSWTIREANPEYLAWIDEQTG